MQPRRQPFVNDLEQTLRQTAPSRPNANAHIWTQNHPADETANAEMDVLDTHRDLVERCKEGRREAQFELYRLYSRAMYNTALRMVGNALDAEDLLQSTFIEVFTKLDSFRYESTIGAWIKRITVNKCINFLKSRRLAFAELTQQTDRAEEPREAEHEPRWSVEKINRAIGELPDGYRVVFSLYALEGYDHEEIGQILGVTEATSKSQYSRAKAKLREALGGGQ